MGCLGGVCNDSGRSNTGIAFGGVVAVRHGIVRADVIDVNGGVAVCNDVVRLWHRLYIAVRGSAAADNAAAHVNCGKHGGEHRYDDHKFLCNRFVHYSPSFTNEYRICQYPI